MAIYSFYSVSSISSDVLFRTLMQNFAAGFVNAGWVKVTQTGEINLTTVNRPAAGTIAGFEIYRMDDALAATYPEFMKVSYAMSSIANIPQLQLQFGKGSNGSGALTGEITDVFLLHYGALATNTEPLYCFVAGGSDWLTIGGFVNAVNGAATFGFSCSRTRLSDGSATNYAINICSYVYSLCKQQILVNSVLGKYPNPALVGFNAAVMNATGIYVGEQGVFPVQPVRGYSDFADMGFVLMYASDIGGNNIVKQTINGAVHTYLTLNALGSAINTVLTGATGLVAIRYE